MTDFGDPYLKLSEEGEPDDQQAHVAQGGTPWRRAPFVAALLSAAAMAAVVGLRTRPAVEPWPAVTRPRPRYPGAPVLVLRDEVVTGKHGDETIGEETRDEDKQEEKDHLYELPRSCPRKNAADDGLEDNRDALVSLAEKEFYPFLSSKPFAKYNPRITHGIIWVHGFSGNVDEYFCNGEEFVLKHKRIPTTITLAPWFGATFNYHGRNWNPKFRGYRMKVWGAFKWMTGEMREIDDATLSSFEMVDVLIEKLQNRSVYPNMKKITLAGFSAGCQFSSRYAFFSESPRNLHGELAPLQVIASNCGSYMYIDDKRPVKSCRKDYDDGADHTCRKFEDPHPHPRRFNRYKVGLNNLKYDEGALEVFKEKFPSKDVRFLLGDMDTCNCNDKTYKNPKHCAKIARCAPSVFKKQCCDTSPDNKIKNVLDVRPSAMVQGYNRFQRGINYVHYLRDHFKTKSWPKYGTFHGGHDSLAFAYSSTFVSWVFGED